MPGFKRIKERTIGRRTKAGKLHSQMHLLADDLINLCHEPSLFAQFLGRIKKIGLPTAYKAYSELKTGILQGEVKEAGKWWMWKTKELTKRR